MRNPEGDYDIIPGDPRLVGPLPCLLHPLRRPPPPLLGFALLGGGGSRDGRKLGLGLREDVGDVLLRTQVHWIDPGGLGHQRGQEVVVAAAAAALLLLLLLRRQRHHLLLPLDHHVGGVLVVAQQLVHGARAVGLVGEARGGGEGAVAAAAAAVAVDAAAAAGDDVGEAAGGEGRRAAGRALAGVVVQVVAIRDLLRKLGQM